MHGAVVVGKMCASAVDGSVDGKVAGIEQVENVVRDDNGKCVELSEREEEILIIKIKLKKYI